MCPRNKSDPDHTLPNNSKELSVVRPKRLTRREKNRKGKPIAKRYALKDQTQKERQLQTVMR